MAMQKWPFWRTWSIRIGFIIIIAALVTSSFATDVWHFVFTQGALYAVGGTLAYGPAIVFLMNGLSAGKGCLWGNVAWAVTVAILAIPLLFVVKRRIPNSQRHHARRLTFNFLKERTFWFVQLGNIFEGLGYFMPTIYLLSYARSLGVRNEAITATVSLLNGAAVFGCIFVGFLIDRFHITTAILISTIEATFSIFVL
uniref:Transporter n=1 Tax=Coccidioides posadasii RMSCC 3488 TaxID=454284 RepID=A0A0J6FSA6_COCPO|nr:transporter [Coccidioides posadasii RMSCC 3488]